MMKVSPITEMLRNGNTVSEIREKIQASICYIRHVKLCIKKGVPTSFYKNRFLSLHPEKKNEYRMKNYEKGAIYDYRSRETYTDQDKELILKFPGTDRELAKILNRSVKAIQVKRVRLRKESVLC